MVADAAATVNSVVAAEAAVMVAVAAENSLTPNLLTKILAV
ncbi:MAG: hypothetical protein WC304_03595 [Candidatus Gracilibacteria bacterium]|jgi:hypothetical protein